ncbi:hypothetical protein ACFL6U_32305 [Planctomycetota bacterium]
MSEDVMKMGVPVNLQSRVEQIDHRCLFWMLSIVFGVFYAVQIPFHTSNADVLVYSLRSLEPVPITEFAFLDHRYQLGDDPLPNYHLGHTLILWLVY